MTPASPRRAAWTALAILLVATSSRFPFRLLPRPAVDPAWKVAWVVLCLLGLYLAHRMRPPEAPAELGLGRPPWRGLGVAFVACLPMLVVLAVAAGGPPSAPAAHPLFRSAVVAPLAEEILFRGYTFLQLRRRAGWGFWPAVLVTALVFGLGHLGNVWGADAGTLLAEVGITALGGAFFGWLLVSWEDDLWVPIGMHAFMNLWWDVYQVDATAIGGTAANVARVLAVAAAIGLTLRHRRNRP